MVYLAIPDILQNSRGTVVDIRKYSSTSGEGWVPSFSSGIGRVDVRTSWVVLSLLWVSSSGLIFESHRFFGSGIFYLLVRCFI